MHGESVQASGRMRTLRVSFYSKRSNNSPKMVFIIMVSECLWDDMWSLESHRQRKLTEVIIIAKFDDCFLSSIPSIKMQFRLLPILSVASTCNKVLVSIFYFHAFYFVER